MVNPNHFRAGTSCEPAYLIIGAIQLETDTTLSLHGHPFLREVVPEMVGRGGGFAQIIRRNLVRGRPIAPDEFRCTLDLVGLLLRWAPTMVTPGSNRAPSEFLLALAAAAQKYDCHGCAKQPHSSLHSGPADIANAFFDTYS